MRIERGAPQRLTDTSPRAKHVGDTTRNVQLPTGALSSSLGLEALAAALLMESAKANGKISRTLEREAKHAQVDALRHQVDALRDKAEHVRDEGIMVGAMTAAGGAMTVGGAMAGPSITAQETNAQFAYAAHKPGATVGDATAAASYGGYVSSQQDNAKALGATGGTTNSLASPIAKATVGAAQVQDDARATEAAADAKFWEAAAGEYGAAARDAQGSLGRIQQLLQGIAQEKQLIGRALVRSF